jgi:hypothetical protein
MSITTLPVSYSDGNVLAAADLTQNFNALNSATIPVANGGTGLTSGTSGGVLSFTAAGTIASSGALTQYGAVYGGGAGAAPVATSAGTAGQLLIGATGAAPAFAALTAGVNIATTTGANSLTVTASATGSKVTLTSGDVSTASTSLVDLTGATITITTAASRYLLIFSCTTSNTSADVQHTFNFAVDGTLQFGTAGMATNVSDAGGSENDGFTMTYLTDVLSAASHTFKVQWKVSAGTGTVRANSANVLHFAAIPTLAVA